MTSLRIKDTRDLCEFLSTNVVEREKLREGGDTGWKEGYLTKRGKNFGGWKTRYFILKGPVLEYFDSVSALSKSKRLEAELQLHKWKRHIVCIPY